MQNTEDRFKLSHHSCLSMSMQSAVSHCGPNHGLHFYDQESIYPLQFPLRAVNRPYYTLESSIDLPVSWHSSASHDTSHIPVTPRSHSHLADSGMGSEDTSSHDECNIHDFEATSQRSIGGAELLPNNTYTPEYSSYSRSTATSASSLQELQVSSTTDSETDQSSPCNSSFYSAYDRSHPLPTDLFVPHSLPIHANYAGPEPASASAISSQGLESLYCLGGGQPLGSSHWSSTSTYPDASDHVQPVSQSSLLVPQLYHASYDTPVWQPTMTWPAAASTPDYEPWHAATQASYTLDPSADICLPYNSAHASELDFSHEMHRSASSPDIEPPTPADAPKETNTMAPTRNYQLRPRYGRTNRSATADDGEPSKGGTGVPLHSRKRKGFSEAELEERAKRRKIVDDLVCELRDKGRTYEHIQRELNLEAGISTLRGRVRLRKRGKFAQMRKPAWEAHDIDLLEAIVAKQISEGLMRRKKSPRAIKRSFNGVKITWSSVARDLEKGASYPFGASSCAEMWFQRHPCDERVAKRKLCASTLEKKKKGVRGVKGGQTNMEGKAEVDQGVEDEIDQEEDDQGRETWLTGGDDGLEV